MLRLFAGTLGWIGLGIILAEVINNLDVIDVRLTLLHALVPAAVYLVFEIALRFQAKNATVVAANHARIRRFYHWILGLVGFLFLISLPFLWWEVIKKLASAHR